MAAALLRRAQHEESAALARSTNTLSSSIASVSSAVTYVESKGQEGAGQLGSAGSTPTAGDADGDAGLLSLEERKTPSGMPLSTSSAGLGDTKAFAAGYAGNSVAQEPKPSNLSRPALVGACLRLRGALGAAEAEAESWKERSIALEKQAADARKRADD